MSSSAHLIRQTCRAVFRALTAERPAVILVRQGCKRIVADRVTLDIPQGTIGVLPANTPLQIENVPQNGRYIASALMPSDDVLAAADLPHGHPHRTTRHDRTVGAFERAVAALDDPLTPERLRAHAMGEVLLWLAEDGIGFGPVRPARFADHLRARLARDLAAPWRSVDAARDMAVSEATLRRRLSSDGTTFGDLLADVRMTHALALLQSTDLPVNRIALDVGYASASRFATRFRARFGVAPSAIRKGNIAGQPVT
ncbi:MAG: helix-turn-helix transcriptional regulator [Pseudomonadota bacterium]